MAPHNANRVVNWSCYAIGLGLAAAGMLTMAGCSGVQLGDIAKAACAAQQAANAAGDIAAKAGSPEWAEKFAEASRIAGIGCAW